MIIADTNIISELLKPVPAPRVEAWLASQNGADIFLTAVSEAELRRGVALLPAGRRRNELAEAIEAIVTLDFAGRVLSFDSAAAAAYAQIFADRRAKGRPISFPDCQIAATARVHGAAIATRNVRDFEDCGLTIVNPWQEPDRA